MCCGSSELFHEAHSSFPAGGSSAYSAETRHLDNNAAQEEAEEEEDDKAEGGSENDGDDSDNSEGSSSSSSSSSRESSDGDEAGAVMDGEDEKEPEPSLVRVVCGGKCIWCAKEFPRSKPAAIRNHQKYCKFNPDRPPTTSAVHCRAFPLNDGSTRSEYATGLCVLARHGAADPKSVRTSVFGFPALLQGQIAEEICCQGRAEHFH